jgi:hypothetical protein
MPNREILYVVAEAYGPDLMIRHLTASQIRDEGIDVSKLPTKRFAIIDSGYLLPIRDMTNHQIYAKIDDLKREISFS